jgi:hypothetical protein
MRDDDERKLCASQFAAQVAQMFDEAEKRAKRALARGCTLVRAPIIGIFYDSWDEQRTERAKRLACNALAARERFKKDHPSWPDLPVSCDELDKVRADPSPRMQLL